MIKSKLFNRAISLFIITLICLILLYKAINIGEKWKIVGGCISLLGFLTLLIFVVVQMIKEKKKPDA